MDPQARLFQLGMQNAVSALHNHSDALVTILEEILNTRPLTDEEVAALRGARRWRSLMESGE